MHEADRRVGEATTGLRGRPVYIDGVGRIGGGQRERRGSAWAQGFVEGAMAAGIQTPLAMWFFNPLRVLYDLLQ